MAEIGPHELMFLAGCDDHCLTPLRLPTLHTQISILFYFLHIFVPDVFISQVNKQTMHFKSITHNSIVIFSLKDYFLPGFEPGPRAPQRHGA
jgi:hypothetical protein